MSILHGNWPCRKVNLITARPGFILIQATQKTRRKRHRQNIVHCDVYPLSATAHLPVQQGTHNGTKRQRTRLIRRLISA